MQAKGNARAVMLDAYLKTWEGLIFPLSDSAGFLVHFSTFNA